MRTRDGVRHIRGIRISDALVIHGGQFDAAIKYPKWFNRVRRKLSFTYWPLSAYLKHRVRNAVEMEGVLYCNDGDWVESCTALVELANGELPIAASAASRRSMPAKAAA
jgi:UDP-2,3-diacylglucosamine pyrophosphatase LpxH